MEKKEIQCQSLPGGLQRALFQYLASSFNFQITHILPLPLEAPAKRFISLIWPQVHHLFLHPFLLLSDRGGKFVNAGRKFQ
jgi:hypothetical protein